MIKRSILVFTVFLSAFLLFLVQPMVAKELLPRFGGTSAVWATCLLFFQFFLLIGYVYADRLSHWFHGTKQSRLHIAILAISLVFLPIELGSFAGIGSNISPGGQVLLLLTTSIGIPYLVLAATGPLLQSFFAESNLSMNVYRLYAVSNIASLLALICYPFTIERWLPVNVQLQIWGYGYVTFALTCAATVWLYSTAAPKGKKAAKPEQAVDDPESPRVKDYLQWIGFAALATALLVAVTLNITLNIASIPLFWILPLAVYLLSFVVTFDSDRWYSHRLAIVPMIFIPSLMLLTKRTSAEEISLGTSIAINTIGLFVCCWFLHGELSARKPSPRYLTRFYMAVSSGGALGGLFGSLMAPTLLTGFHELEFLLLIIAGASFWILRHTLGKNVASYSVLTTFFVSVVFCGLLGLANLRKDADTIRAEMRNFYGVLTVKDSTDSDGRTIRTLFNGTIQHGSQVAFPEEKSQIPGDYYGKSSGVGMAIESLSKSPRRVGVIGLGAGVLAAYERTDDIYTFYEINPQSVEVAKTLFSYLQQAKSVVNIEEGDARLILNRNDIDPPSEKFDLLAVDAFSGDAIPMHLLTLEAFQIYRSHLTESGILAMHISNKYLDLRPVLLGATQKMGMNAYEVISMSDGDRQFSAAWVLMVKSTEPYKDGGWVANGKQLIAQETTTKPIIWTDSKNNLLDVLAND